MILCKNNTQGKVCLYFQELDVNGNHLSWNTIDGDLQSGHYDYNYTVNASHKLILRIDKTNTHTDEPSSFLIDHISVTSGALQSEENYSKDRFQGSPNTLSNKNDVRQIVEENNYYPFELKYKYK